MRDGLEVGAGAPEAERERPLSKEITALTDELEVAYLDEVHQQTKSGDDEVVHGLVVDEHKLEYPEDLSVDYPRHSSQYHELLCAAIAAVNPGKAKQFSLRVSEMSARRHEEAIRVTMDASRSFERYVTESRADVVRGGIAPGESVH